MSVPPGTDLARERRWGLLLLLIAGGTLALDQISKHGVRQGLGPYATRQVIPGVLNFSPSTNPGGAFGLFPSVPWLFVAVAVVALGVAFYYRRQILDAGPTVRVSVALLLGGTLGNLMDRLRFGHVQDFIQVKTAALIGFDWPTFNIADMAITGGTFLFIGHLLYLEFRERAQKTVPEDPSA